MSRSVKPRRPYDSPRRRAQAEATRRRILDAARTLFTRHGYAGTTIDAIAAEAGVAPETVYGTFRNKRSILWRLVEIGAAGDERPIPVQQREWVGRLSEEPDQRKRARLLARGGREILERSSAILVVLRDAAASDPKIAEAWTEANERMLVDHRAFVRALAGREGLRRGLTVEQAADIFWTLGSPEVYDRLVHQRGWSPRAFERWLRETLERTMLPPVRAKRAAGGPRS